MSGCFCFSNKKEPDTESFTKRYDVDNTTTIASQENEKNILKEELERRYSEDARRTAELEASRAATEAANLRAAELQAAVEAALAASEEMTRQTLQAKLDAEAALAEKTEELKQIEEARLAEKARLEEEAARLEEEAAAKKEAEAKKVLEMKKQPIALPEFGTMKDAPSKYSKKKSEKTNFSGYPVENKPKKVIPENPEFLKQKDMKVFDIPQYQNISNQISQNSRPEVDYNADPLSMSTLINSFMSKNNFKFDGRSFVPDAETKAQNYQSYINYPNQEQMSTYSVLPQPVMAYDNFGNLIPILNATNPSPNIPFASYTPHPEGGILAYDENGNPVKFSENPADWDKQAESFNNYNTDYSNFQMNQNQFNDQSVYEASKIFENQVENYNTNINNQRDMNKIVNEKLRSKAPDLPDDGSYLPQISIGSKKRITSIPDVKETKPKQKVEVSIKNELPVSSSSQYTTQTPTTNYTQATENTNLNQEPEKEVLLPKTDGTYELMSIEKYTEYVNKGYSGLALQVVKNDPQSIKYALYVAKQFHTRSTNEEQVKV